MKSVHILFRRTAAVLGAIAALTVTGIATSSQEITLKGASGNTCSFGSMTVTPNGKLEVQCDSGGTGPGQLSLSSTGSLASGTANTGGVFKVTRTSGSTGAVGVNYSASGACSEVSPSPISFADGETGSKNVEVATGSTAGTCTVSISSPSGGATLGTASRSVAVTDPNADVQFAFQGPSSANVGGGPVQITVNRTGGINGTWSVPYTLSGSLTNAGLMLPGAGTVSGTLTFTGSTNGTTPGNSSDIITYNPPGTTPVTGLGNLIVSFGTPTGGAGGQAATTGSPHQLTLNGPAVGCPAETVVRDLETAGNTTLTALASGVVATFALPEPSGGKVSGIFKLSETTSTYPGYPDGTPWNYEIHINKCRGLVQAPPTGVKDACYSMSANMRLHTKVWFNSLTSRYTTPAILNTMNFCYAPKNDGPWYINIRYTYSQCAKLGSACGWHAQWTNYAY